MLDDLKFVQGAIKKNNITPELEHYKIANGRIVGYNGHMALSSPIELDIEAYPKAAMFNKAIAACKETVAINLTEAGRLSIKSGGFKAFVPCLDSMYHEADPQGDTFEAPKGLLKLLTRALPFVSDDASRPWAMGALIHGGSLYATNNVVAVELWHGIEGLPDCNIPRFALVELARIGKQPVAIQTDGSSMTFHFDNSRWLRTALYSKDWPFATFAKLLNVECSSPEPFQKTLADAVERIAPFAESDATPLFFEPNGLTTSTNPEEGVTVAVEGLPAGPAFNLKQMRLVSAEAETIDWTHYPRPCVFFGKSIRGVIMGRSR